MSLYEWTFGLGKQPTDDQDNFLAEQFDAIVSVHDGSWHASLVIEGEGAGSAALGAIDLLRANGIQVEREVWDLVGRTEIAERAGVSKQAVSLWTAGKRNPHPAGEEFPDAFGGSGGGQWVWGDVLPWLREVAAADVESDVDAPTSVDLATVRVALASDTGVTRVVHGKRVGKTVLSTETPEPSNVVDFFTFISNGRKPSSVRMKSVIQTEPRKAAHA